MSRWQSKEQFISQKGCSSARFLVCLQKLEKDVNHDGFIDLPETEAVYGTTMVPFDDAPQEMNIPRDGY